jgi:hypothetical protein
VLRGNQTCLDSIKGVGEGGESKKRQGTTYWRVAKASVRKVSVRTMKGRKEKKKGAGRRTLLSFHAPPPLSPNSGGSGRETQKTKRDPKTHPEKDGPKRPSFGKVQTFRLGKTPNPGARLSSLDKSAPTLSRQHPWASLQLWCCRTARFPEVFARLRR